MIDDSKYTVLAMSFAMRLSLIISYFCNVIDSDSFMKADVPEFLGLCKQATVYGSAIDRIILGLCILWLVILQNYLQLPTKRSAESTSCF